MAFSLSPSVDVREFDLSMSVPNLPSAKTGMVIRSNVGEALAIQSITSERDLINAFGKPNAYNYQDWFNAWNFLQYASSLYVVRGMDKDVENAGMELVTENGFVNVEQLSQNKMYNPDQAQLTLEQEIIPEGLQFWNKDVSPNQNYAVAVCMSPANWDLPFSADGLNSLVSVASFDSTADVGTGSSAIQSDYNTLIVGDAFEFQGATYTVSDVTGAVVTVTPEITENGDGSTAYVGIVTGTTALTPAVEAYRNAKFSSDLVNADGSFVSFSSFFEYKPDFAKGEFVVVVFDLDDDGLFDNIEEFTVGKTETARDVEGRNIFIEEVFFKSSKLLFARWNQEYAANIDTAFSPFVELSGTAVDVEAVEPEWLYPRKKEFAADGTTFIKWIFDPLGYATADIMNGFELFEDPEAFDINLLISHQIDINRASTICSTRKDCLAIVAPYDYPSLVGKSASDATEWMTDNFGSQKYPMPSTYYTFNSYSAVYGNMKYQYDKFNDVNRWLCIAGDIAGLAAQTDANRDPWWAFAGLERGKIRNAIKPAFNPNKQNRDDLYINSINPIMSVPGEGVMVVWGQKTATARPSAFDRVNVRRLLITIEKAISTVCKYVIFEFNDEFTRARLRGMIEPFLRDVKGRRGIYDFMVVVDGSNNTAEVIDNNALVVDIYIKPTKVAEFIQLNVNVTRTDANFEELIAR